MRKKLLLVCATVVLLLSACSSNAGQTNGQPAAESTAPVQSTSDAETAPDENEDESEVLDGDLVGVEDFASSFNAETIDPQDIVGFIDAVGFGMKDAVLAYIEAGVDIDGENEYGSTALSTAVIYEELALVQLLLEHGANINYQNAYGNTALISATDMGVTNMVEYLLENGADPNIGGGENQDYYPIISAAFLGHVDIVALLLSYDAYPNLAYWHMDEAVDASWIAEEQGYPEIVELINSVE